MAAVRSPVSREKVIEQLTPRDGVDHFTGFYNLCLRFQITDRNVQKAKLQGILLDLVADKTIEIRPTEYGTYQYGIDFFAQQAQAAADGYVDVT